MLGNRKLSLSALMTVVGSVILVLAASAPQAAADSPWDEVEPVPVADSPWD